MPAVVCSDLIQLISFSCNAVMRTVTLTCGMRSIRLTCGMTSRDKLFYVELRRGLGVANGHCDAA